MSLVSTDIMLQKAREGQYAVGAFNIENMEFAQAVIEAAQEAGAPVIVATSVNTLKNAPPGLFFSMVSFLASQVDVPVAIHLDHGRTLQDIMAAIHAGYKSVMIDASMLTFAENIELTKSVVDACSMLDISIEAELGMVHGKEDIEKTWRDQSPYTEVDEAVDFVAQTGCDSLAVAIGSRHGIYKSSPNLNYGRLQEIHAAVGIPLVLHGASGLSDEQLEKCVEGGICKVNIATDLRAKWVNVQKEIYAGGGKSVMTKEVKHALKRIVRHKINVLSGKSDK